MCPVTRQPDLSNVVIEYGPDQSCIESKSLKLYLWGFRDRAVFAEALAAEIAGEIFTTAACMSVEVRLTQRPCCGITVGVTAFRLAPTHSAGQPIVAGWCYQWICPLNWTPDRWTARLDVRRIVPRADTTSATIEQVRQRRRTARRCR